MNHKTIVLGLEHFIDKIGYQAEEYANFKIPVKYLVLDTSGFTKEKAGKYNADVTIVSKNIFVRLLQTVKALYLYKPKWCELYDIGRLTIVYAFLAKLFGCKLIFILRGHELWNRTMFNLQWLGLSVALKISDHVIAKEINIIEDLKIIKFNESRITHICNCIVTPKIIQNNKEKDIDILYLNSVKRHRNASILVDALYQLLKINPSYKIVIIGFTSLDDNDYKMEPDYEKEVLEKINNLGLKDKIEIKGFVKEPEQYFRRSKIFALPGDIIYLNYSLLEAMSYEVAPLVGDGEGAELVIEDKINGLIVSRKPDAILEGLLYMLEENNYRNMGMKARETVISKFSMKIWVKKMLEVRDKVIN